MKPEDYRRVSSHEGEGLGGEIGVQLFIHMKRDLTTEEASAISALTEQIFRSLCSESMRQSPEGKKERDSKTKNLLALFPYAMYVEEIPNEYLNSYSGVNSPWFLVTTYAGHFKIGWRSSVIVIDWERSRVKQTPTQLFPEENVSKGDSDQLWIHAWGYEKAQEYVQKLHQAANVSPKDQLAGCTVGLLDSWKGPPSGRISCDHDLPTGSPLTPKEPEHGEPRQEVSGIPVSKAPEAGDEGRPE